MGSPTATLLSFRSPLHACVRPQHHSLGHFEGSYRCEATRRRALHHRRTELPGVVVVLPEELLTGPIRTPDEERRAIERARRQRELERELERARRDPDREVAADAAFKDRVAPPSLNPLDRITAERRAPRLEVAQTETEVARGTVRLVSRTVNALFLAVYALLGLRLVVAVLSANPDASFVRWITAVSDPLVAPFRGVFPSVTAEDGITFTISVAFAMLVYALFHALVHSVLRMFGAPRGVL